MKKGKKVALITLKMFKQRTVFAYVPAWAIGTGNFAQLEEANEMHEMIRKIIAEKNATYAKHVKIIYGGLVGCCSIDPSAFTKICEIADRFKCGDMAE
jgi:triosephosphate isomerase